MYNIVPHVMAYFTQTGTTFDGHYWATNSERQRRRFICGCVKG